MRKNKNLMLLGLSAVVGGVAIGVVGTQFGRLAAHADGHCADGEHNGNHYTAVAPDGTHAGNEEFWACCVCGEAFLANPGGTWVDQGAFEGELPTNHVAYIAPVADHDYLYHVKSFEAGHATVQLYCADCGTYTGEEKVVAGPSSFTKALGSDYASTMADAVSVTFSSTYAMVWDDSINGFKSTNKGVDSSKSQVTLTFADAGTVEFEIGSDAESSWDYVKCLTNDATKITNVVANGSAQSSITSVTTSGQISKKVSATVAAGAQITFSFEKDSSGKSGTDTGWVKDIRIGSPAFASEAEEVAVTLEANNGVELDPVVTLKGSEATLPTPTKSDYYFGGWFKDAEFTIPFAGAVNEDVRAYARWIDESQKHVLMGKNYGYYISSGSYSSVSVGVAVFLEVDLIGNYRLQINNSTYTEGMLASYDVETGVMLDTNGNKFVYDAATGLIYCVLKSGTNSYVMVLKKGSTGSMTSSNMAAQYFTSGKQKVVRVNEGGYHWAYFDIETGDIYKDVEVEVLSGTKEVVAPSDMTSNFLVAVKQNDNVVAKFGYAGSSSSLDKADDTYSGVYTTSDGKEVALCVTANKKYARYSGHTSPTTSMTVSNITGDTVRIFSSASYDYTVTLDRTNMTCTVVANTLPLNIEWNGHTPENAVSQLDYVAGKWAYLSDLPISVGTVIEEEGGRKYKLEGWYRDEQLTQKITSSFQINDATTIYANWIEVLSATITFDSNGGSECAPQTVETASKYTGTLPTPTLSGHKFIGWYTDAECTVAFNPEAVITGSFTLYAKWVAAPAWALLESAPDAVVDNGVTIVSGSTDANFTTRYTKVHFAAGTYIFETNTPTYHAGTSGVSGNGYQRFEIVDASGAAVINKAFAARSNKETIEIAVEGDYFIKFNATGYGMVSTSGTTGQKDGAYSDDYEIKFVAKENYSIETAATYTVGDTLHPTFPAGILYDKYYKVHLEQGNLYEFRIQGTNSYSKLTISKDGTTAAGKVFKFGGSVSYMYCNSRDDKVVTATFDLESGDYYIIVSTVNEVTITDLSASAGLPCDGNWTNEGLVIDLAIADRKLILNDAINSVSDEELTLIDSTENTWTFFLEGVSDYNIVIARDDDGNFYIQEYTIDGYDYLDGYELEELYLTEAE